MDQRNPATGLTPKSLSPAPVDPLQAEKDNQQGYDDTCGCRVIAEACELAGLIPPEHNNQRYIDEWWQAINPGQSENTGGTGLTGVQTVLGLACKEFGASAQHFSWLNTKEQLIAALQAGQYVCFGVALGDLLPGFSSYHWLLALKYEEVNGQGFVRGIDSCHDVDFDPDDWPIEKVMQATADLFGPDYTFGLTFTLTR